MPVHGMNVGESPPNPTEAKAAGYLTVFIDVSRVIIVNEVVPKCLAKDNPRNRCETDTDAYSLPARDGPYFLRNTSRLLINHTSGFSLVDQNVFTQLWH